MLRVSFYVRKPQGPTGKHRIYFRTTLDGQRSVAYATPVFLTNTDAWDASTVFVHKDPTATTVLRGIQSDLMRLAYYLDERNQKYTAHSLIRMYTKGSKSPKLLKDFIDDFLERQRSVVSPSTVTSYATKFGGFLRFLTANKYIHLTVPEVTDQLLDKYMRHLLITCSHNYAARAVELVLRVIKESYKEAGIKYNPVADYHVKRERSKEIVFLYEDELTQVTSFPYASETLQTAADLFVFACWTGLSVSDMMQYEYLRDTHMVDGTPAIIITRQKTGARSVIPLTQQAIAILAKYHYVLPRLTAQYYNRCIKQLAALVGIRKDISSHTARKTFATLFLNRGVSLEVVARMLGHQSVTVTEKYYAALLDGRVVREVLASV